MEINKYDPDQAVKRDPEITIQLKTMAEKLTHLYEAVEVLAKRLDSILTPMPPTPVEKDMRTASNTSPMATDLQEYNDRIQIAIDYLHHLLSRLEI